MNQKEQLIDLFRRNNNRLYLSQIMRTTLAAEYRARITELRRKGYEIICTKTDRRSENIYTLIPPDPQMKLFR